MKPSIISPTALRKAIFNAIKYKTNVELVAEPDSMTSSRTGGPYCSSIWLKCNSEKDGAKQYTVGQIFNNTRSINDTDASLESCINSVNIKTLNAINQLSTSQTITLDNTHHIPGLLVDHVDVEKVPIVDGRFVMEKLLRTDIQMRNIDNTLRQTIAWMSNEIQSQNLLLTATDFVCANEVGAYVSKVYETKSGDKLTYDLDTASKTFHIDMSDLEYHPNAIYVCELRYDIYKPTTNGIMDITSSDNVYATDLEVVPNVSVEKYSLSL